MLQNKKICIFCASSSYINNRYIKASQKLGELLAAEKAELIFGGGTEGLMGAVARIFKLQGCRVTSIIPEKLNQKGVLFEGSDEIIITKTMNERKKIMADISDAFIALPGGFGTLEEIMEIITLKQLGYLNKPIVIFNSYGFYDNLLKLINLMHKRKFINDESLKLYFTSNNPQKIYKFIKNLF
jgi:cytokinin riboside 5'-monophosphate phosphoribohydrolase